MSVLQKEIRKCKHEKCETAKKWDKPFQLCTFYIKEYDGCDY